MTPLPRIAGVTVGAVAVGAVTGRLALDVHDPVRVPDGIVATGIGVGIGSLGVIGGTAAARAAEQALRPGIARAGRAGAALGAALVAGSLVGEVASRFLGVVDGRRVAGAVRDDRAQQQARIDAPQDETKQATGDARRFERLADEFAPLPAEAAARPRPDDGRLDIAGAPIAAAARALHQRYDVDGDDLVGIAELQRPISGGSASIMTLMSTVSDAQISEAAETGVPIGVTTADLEQVIAERVDTGGIDGVIDNDEAIAWFGPDGVGEKAIVWDGAGDFLDSLAAPSHRNEQATYAPGAWREGGDDILYLAGITDEASAKQQLQHLAINRQPAALLVRLPYDAPTTFGIVRLLTDGKRSGAPYDDTLVKLSLDSAVVAVRGRGDVIDL